MLSKGMMMLILCYDLYIIIAIYEFDNVNSWYWASYAILLLNKSFFEFATSLRLFLKVQ